MSPTRPAISPSNRDLTVTTFRSDNASSRRPFLVACTTITGSALPLERGIRSQRSTAVLPDYSFLPRSSERQVRLGLCLEVDSLRVGCGPTSLERPRSSLLRTTTFRVVAFITEHKVIAKILQHLEKTKIKAESRAPAES